MKLLCSVLSSSRKNVATGYQRVDVGDGGAEGGAERGGGGQYGGAAAVGV
ncbi:hypothetical protein L195_g033237 [Trifolium pratense]|uniref:Uncharacterized protein n=1 Tax=Trifolium pratense TaxID=57577 RepID=A0A2K3LFI4_TRIPR|nr:hypothetical protein L195_g033237 [Trifolium pratense]